jgi:hypothetical protein
MISRSVPNPRLFPTASKRRPRRLRRINRRKKFTSRIQRRRINNTHPTTPIRTQNPKAHTGNAPECTDTIPARPTKRILREGGPGTLHVFAERDFLGCCASGSVRAEDEGDFGTVVGAKVEAGDGLGVGEFRVEEVAPGWEADFCGIGGDDGTGL